MTRADMPPDPAGVIRSLRSCREAMTGVQARVRPSGPVYHGAAMVKAAIDAFATLLTGERYYFSIGGSTPGGASSGSAEAPAREGGEKLWDP